MVVLGPATPGGGFPVYGQARPTLPDDVAYRLARALHRGEPALGRRLPQARETTAANTVAAAPRPDIIHGGALRYFREIGLIR